MQAAYRAAGISLPGVAQDQYDVGPLVPAGQPLEPGDLVFFGGSDTDVEHVGLYIGTEGGQTVMVDAPYSDAAVRVEPLPAAVVAPFGDLVHLGATRPGR